MSPGGEPTTAGTFCAGLSPEQIRRQLAAVTSSKGFRQSRSLVKFLAFIVDETLAGRSDALKEYVVGVNVFGRGAGFDPKVDTIVRVQARNLRSKLAAYYREDGRADPVILELSPGSYVPVFRLAAAGATQRSPLAHRRELPWAYLLVSAVVIGAVVFVWGKAIATDRLPDRLERLTSDSAFTGHPSISADGRWLAYASDREVGATDIWIQPTSGVAPPVRITNDPARDEFPSLSPDGSRVVFRSWRQGGGIWISPAAESRPRLLAARGYFPRFSPDGSTVLYTATGPDDTTDRLYVVPAAGGTPRVLRTYGAESTCGIWTPDGKRVLFVDAIRDDANQYDWFVTSTDGSSSVVRTGLADRLARQRIAPMNKLTCASGWWGDEVLFNFGELRAVTLSRTSWTVSGPIRTVLPASAYFASVSRSPDRGLYLYYSLEEDLGHLWSLPISAGTGLATGALERLGASAGTHIEYSADQRFSRDQKTLWFVTNASTIWRLTKSDGRVVRVSEPRAIERHPIPDRSGNRLLFQAVRDSKTSVFVAEGASRREICSDCGDPLDWLPHGNGFLSSRDGNLFSVDLDSGAQHALWTAGSVRLYDAALSPDGDWLALTVAEHGNSLYHGYLARFPDGLQDPEHWIAISAAPFELYLAWSPDGNRVYYFDTRDQFRCLYEQKLGVGKQPVGAPFAVQHFHQMIVRGSRIAVSDDRLVVSAASRHSNIWRVRLVENWISWFPNSLRSVLNR